MLHLLTHDMYMSMLDERTESVDAVHAEINKCRYGSIP